MSQATGGSTRLAVIASLTALVLLTSHWAFADPCAEGCRSQHNTCRMNAKLLFSPRCDAALQACISGCFAQDRFNRRRDREERALPDMHGGSEIHRGQEFRGPPAFGMPGFGRPRGPGFGGGRR
jgi:hypothetical protein